VPHELAPIKYPHPKTLADNRAAGVFCFATDTVSQRAPPV
jgi:hypothetical protein